MPNPGHLLSWQTCNRHRHSPRASAASLPAPGPFPQGPPLGGGHGPPSALPPAPPHQFPGPSFCSAAPAFKNQSDPLTAYKPSSRPYFVRAFRPPGATCRADIKIIPILQPTRPRARNMRGGIQVHNVKVLIQSRPKPRPYTIRTAGMFPRAAPPPALFGKRGRGTSTGTQDKGEGRAGPHVLSPRP